MTETTYDELEGSNVRPTPPDEGSDADADSAVAEAAPADETEAAPEFPARLSREGAAFIARFEGFRAQLYNDPAGHCTIGIGHLVHLGRCNGSEPAEFKRGITRQRAFELLQEDARAVVAAVRRHVRVPLAQHQLDALCSWGFNCGTGVFTTSTLVRKLNEGDFAAVPGELNRWVKAGSPPRPLPGLVRRRRAEGELFARGRYS